MNKIEIDLDKLQKPELFFEEYLFLQILNEGIDIYSLNWERSPVAVEFRLRVLEQNLWCKKTDEGWELRQKGKDLFVDSKESINFDVFWDSYHTITKLPKSDREAASKYWKKLKVSEKTKAFDNVKAYYDSLSDKRYCKKCRTYLADKNFNDEFKVIEIKRTTAM